MRWLRDPRVIVPGAAVLLAGAAWLAFGYFAVHLLWVDDKVDEALPTFDATAPANETPATTVVLAAAPEPTTSEPTTSEPTSTESTSAETTQPPTPQTTVPATSSPTTSAPTTTVPATAAPPTPAAIVEEVSGTFVSLDHDTSGRAVVLGNGTDQRFLRFEDFSTSNGPDLNVYLVNSAAGGVTDFVDLGDMKGNVGNQNYEIPAGVDLAVYDKVLIWCVRFSSPFGEALLA
jgi:hypothetical protein